MSELLSQLKDLSPEKRELILAKLRQKKGQTKTAASTPSTTIPVTPRTPHMPLSFAQQRLWFLDQLDDNKATYNISGAYHLTGPLHIQALEKSFQAIVQRHESLRTTFTLVGGRPFQTVIPTTEVALIVKDLQSLPDQEAQVQRFATADARHPFDLTQAPLIRMTLLKLAPQRHVLLLNMHHIVSDAWSMEIFVEELAHFYHAFTQDQAPTLPPLPIQYPDFAAWQRQQLSEDALAHSLAYWRTHLADAPAILELPLDHPRPPIQQFNGRTHPFRFEPELSHQLKQISQQAGASLFMTLFTALVTLLYRHTHQEDIVIGTPLASRDHQEIEPLIGFFVNTLVLRTSLAGNPDFLTLLHRVKQTTLAAYDHPIPFDLLVDALQPQRNLSHTPLFQVVFSWQNDPVSTVKLADLTVTPLAIEEVSAKFDLILHLENGADGLAGSWEYNTDLFEAATIHRLTQQWHTLLQGIAAQPHQPIAHLPLLTAREKQQLLQEWNHPPVTQVPPACLHHLFAQQAARTPGKTAVVFDHRSLTYQELDQQANQLAHHLRHLGVGPDQLVGLCLERSLEMIVGLLAILKAGGAYLPLDPDAPQSRLNFILADAQVSVLLTHTTLQEKMAATNMTILCLDEADDILAQYDRTPPPTTVTPAHLAYAIYTSGSTGQPKGVLINHTNVHRLFTQTDHWFHFDHTDTWTLFHSYAFDFSVWEIWGALLYGGKLVVVPYWISRDPEAFYQLLGEQQVTVLNQTPSAFGQLMQAEERLGMNPDLKLRLVIFGGEALELHSLHPWFDRHGDQLPQLVNMYGITETTVHVTYRPLTRADLDAGGSMIGRPIPDLQIFILDQHLQLLPVGVPGEMHIAGAGLARGYLNRAPLTTTRFITNPFGPGRLYRSGDLARYLPNGDIEYLGRTDHQVKIRGFRIESGEIETALNRHETIRASVVIPHTTPEGTPYLVAYLTGNDIPASDSLRQFLQTTLPDYMVPAVFIVLEKFPLTTNGKVDRKKLPAPESGQRLTSATYTAPRTPTEQTLARIWRDVLGVERVGIHDNFFDLGGDSIRSINVLAQARQAGLDFSLQQLFQHQTIAQLSQVFQAQQPATLPPQKTAAFSLISPQDRAKLPADAVDAYPLTALQLGMLYHNLHSADATMYHDVFSYQVRVRCHLPALRQAIQHLIDTHPVLRTSFAVAGFSQPLQIVHQRVDAPLTIEHLDHLSPTAQDEAIRQWVTQEKKRPIDHKTPPLIRFGIHYRSNDTFNLSLSFHHAILDGWSVATMLTELFHHYLAHTGQEMAPILPSTSHFRDFVALEQATLAWDASRDYWQQQLTDVTIANLPRWPHAYRAADGPQQGSLDVPISTETTAALQQVAQQAGVPLKSLLLAIHMWVLSRVTNQSDVLTGYVTNGRLEEIDGERTLGLFLNTLPFRLQLTSGSWLALAQATFQAEQALLPFRRHPLAHLQQMAGGQALFETSFNFTHFHVYQAVTGVGGVEMVGGEFFEYTNFTLTADFNLNPTSSQLHFAISYDAHELCQAQAAAIGRYYTAALTAAAAAAHAPHHPHSPLTPEEKQQLLIEWNNTDSHYPQQSCFHHLFEVQAQQTPDAPALIQSAKEMTYRLLNQQANQLAHSLRKLGVGPDVPVGIYMDRSLEMVVGLLAILKAGGAYLPLDPDYPPNRLAFILADAQVPVLLTQESLLERLPPLDIEIICLEQKWLEISQESTTNLSVRVTPEHLAYIIYTSGSTGLPKGVAVTHQGVMNYLSWGKQAYPVDKGHGSLVHSSIAFDLTVTGLWLPLLAGATVELLPPEADITLLATSLQQKPGFSLVKITPAHLDLLRHQVSPSISVPLTYKFIIGGEQLLSEQTDFWQSAAPGTTLINEYGPTETVVGCCVYTVPLHEPQPQSIPIGRPIANTTLYILDAHLNPVPLGTPGELYIGGHGLARGYLNRPDLTAARFVPHPFSQEGGARLYKTGDLARYLPDGNIEFLGRIDHQVKIRGYRIELGEIEATLVQHPLVQEAVVIADETRVGAKQLIAYIIPTLDKPITNQEWRDFLTTQLPPYMIPTFFVTLPQLPLTVNGKIDRHALPALDANTRLQTTAYVPPQTESERHLAALWREILGLEQVGIDDNFFELGGHSLMVVRLIAQIEAEMEVSLPLARFYDQPTIRHLAQVLAQENETLTAWSPLVKTRPFGEKRPFFCALGAGITTFTFNQLAQELASDQPFYTLRPPGPDDHHTLYLSVPDLAHHYLEAIRHIQPRGPYQLGGHSFGGLVAYEMAQILAAAGEAVTHLILMDTLAPLPLMRTFMRLPEAPVLEASPSEASPSLEQAVAQALYHYPTQVRPYTGKMVLLQAQQSPLNAQQRRDPLYQPYQTPHYGWASFIQGPLITLTVPGNHLTMLAPPHIKVLAKVLNQQLGNNP